MRLCKTESSDLVSCTLLQMKLGFAGVFFDTSMEQWRTENLFGNYRTSWRVRRCQFDHDGGKDSGWETLHRQWGKEGKQT